MHLLAIHSSSRPHGNLCPRLSSVQPDRALFCQEWVYGAAPGAGLLVTTGTWREDRLTLLPHNNPRNPPLLTQHRKDLLHRAHRHHHTRLDDVIRSVVLLRRKSQRVVNAPHRALPQVTQCRNMDLTATQLSSSIRIFSLLSSLFSSSSCCDPAQ